MSIVPKFNDKGEFILQQNVRVTKITKNGSVRIVSSTQMLSAFSQLSFIHGAVHICRSQIQTFSNSLYLSKPKLRNRITLKLFQQGI